MQPNIVILAGGISSRMRKAAPASVSLDPAWRRDAEEKAKTMIGVGSGSRPFLDYLLYNVSSAGYREAVIVIGENDESIRAYYDAGGSQQFKNLSISYAVQPIPPGRDKPLGTADALWHGLRARRDWCGQAFTVCNSDNLYSVAALQTLLHDTHGNALIDYDRAALQFAQSRIEQFAVIQKDAEGFLQNIIEKPSAEEIAQAAESDGRIGVSMNIFRLSYDQIFPCVEAAPLHPVRREKELPAAVQMMVAQSPRSVFAIPRAEHVPDLTIPTDIPEVRAYLEKEYHGF